MESFTGMNYDGHTSAYVRRRLAEATLSQDEHDGSYWRQLDPGPSAITSLSPRAQSLHNGLLGNALQHIDEYMDQETYTLAIGENLDSQLGLYDPWYSESMDTASRDSGGYMERPSASHVGGETTTHTVEMKHEQQDAATPAAKQKATIIYYGDDNALKTLQVVDLEAVTKRCPLLGMAFEESRSGPQLYLETLSSRTAEPFLRFLHTGTYAEPSEEWNSGGRYEDVPTSVLFHCQMYRLGDIYDLADMKSQAYVNVLRQCEFGCSSPDKPIDLCNAIRFVYANLEKEEQLIDAIIHYCVACFLRHRLAEDAEFKQLAYDLRPFHQDLCKNCINREFENETASAIIQMPFEPHRPETYASTEHRRSFHDVVYHFHAEDEMDSPKKRRRTGKETVLPIRPVQELSEKKVKQMLDIQSYFARFMSEKPEISADADSDGSLEEIKSENEFEEVDLSPAPKGEADSDSESSKWVDVMPMHPKKVDSTDPDSVPSTQTQVKVEEGEANESDSDWSLV